MSGAKNHNPYAKIDAVLRKAAHELPRLPGWWNSLAQLTKASSAETRLAVYQAVRDDGCLPEDAGFFLVSFTVDCITASAARSASKDLDDRMDRLAEENDLTDLQGDASNDALAEYEALEQESSAVWDRCFAEQLAGHAEQEMADLFVEHPDEFDRRQDEGRRFFYEPAASGAAGMRASVQTLFDHVRRCVRSDLPMGPLACRWHLEHDILDLQVFPTPIELVGGPQDGAVVDPDMDVALLDIQEFFDEVSYVSWSVEGDKREYQYLWVQGVYDGFDVWLTVFAGAPDGERPTVKSDESRKWRPIRRNAAD